MDKVAIGIVIKNKRKEKNLKQHELAAATELSRNYISDIENGRYMPSVETLSKVAVVLGMDLNFLTMTEIQVNQEGEGKK